MWNLDENCGSNYDENVDVNDADNINENDAYNYLDYIIDSNVHEDADDGVSYNGYENGVENVHSLSWPLPLLPLRLSIILIKTFFNNNADNWVVESGGRWVVESSGSERTCPFLLFNKPVWKN